MSIGVVIPSYNRPDGLKAALDSLINQSVIPDQVVVIDDCSDYDCKNLINSYKSLNIKLLKNSFSMGACYSRNRGVSELGTEYVAFLDDDDAFTSEKIDNIRAIISVKPEIDVFYHNAKICIEGSNISYITSPTDLTHASDPYKLLLQGNCVGGTPMVIVKVSTFNSVNGFDESMESLQDYELWLRLARNGAKFNKIDMALTLYSVNFKASSISKSLEKNERSIDRIKTINKAGFESLSAPEHDKFKVWCLGMRVHKALLSGRKFEAIKYQMEVCKVKFSIKNMILLFTLIFGRRFVFWVRSVS